MIKFTLSFEGNDADDHEIDFYDVAQSLIGFQRSLAITTNLILNGEVITQAPSLKNARIIALPPEEGSWKVVAAIALTSHALTTASIDTPLGHIMHSAYDYVISESMGFHVDYKKTLGQQYEELQEKKGNKLPIIEQSKFDSVIEKCEYAIQEMHRPIIKSETAQKAGIYYNKNGEDVPLTATLTHRSYDYIKNTEQTTDSESIRGKVSSYNINTFKGRIFVPNEQRPISFELSNAPRNSSSVKKIMDNMTTNAHDRFTREGSGEIELEVLKNTSRSGHLKSYYVLGVN